MNGSNEDKKNALTFTGERFTPECVREIWYEHWHRYVFALPMARGKRVLDAACGEGYGSALLATVAESVSGVDIDADSVAHAQRRYGVHDKLRFHQSSVTAIDAPDASFDLIVSYETVEHLHEQEQMLDEFQRLLAPGGVLLISSPDRERYNQGGEANPHHVRELSREELLDLVSRRFAATQLYGQQLAFSSVLWRLGDEAGQAVEFKRLDTGDGTLHDGPVDDPVYYVCVCARDAGDLPATPKMSLFADEQASVYNHYNAEIARLIRADHRIIALERELAELRSRLSGHVVSPDNP